MQNTSSDSRFALFTWITRQVSMCPSSRRLSNHPLVYRALVWEATKLAACAAPGCCYYHPQLSGRSIAVFSRPAFMDESQGKACGKPALVFHQMTPAIYASFLWLIVHRSSPYFAGLAVGVGFGAIGKSKANTFEAACNLAMGIGRNNRHRLTRSRTSNIHTLDTHTGLQNFPEGLAVSLPLLRLGYSPLRAFWWGQLSGMVEPLGGILGAVAIGFAERFLPYALAFAAGAMIYVVVVSTLIIFLHFRQLFIILSTVFLTKAIHCILFLGSSVQDDLIPEARVHGNTRLASAGSAPSLLLHTAHASARVILLHMFRRCMVGFVIMMSMDVGLG